MIKEKVVSSKLIENPDLKCILKYADKNDVPVWELCDSNKFDENSNYEAEPEETFLSYDLFRSEQFEFESDKKVISIEKLNSFEKDNLRKDPKNLLYDKLIKENKAFESLIGVSDEINRVKREIFHIRDKNCKVLFFGESGTGKNLAAKVLHRVGNLNSKKFVGVNVGALQKDLVETTLFGSVKGAYTDAINRTGLINLADGGVLFMDEIGELSLECQPHLLRALDDGVYRKVGSDIEEKADVRFVFATNSNLKKLVKKKLFREDLYWRIAEFVIDIPPLRNRKEDIPIIANKFLDDINQKNTSQYKCFSPNAIDKLLMYDWPGNIRELKTCINISTIYSHTELIEPSDIKFI